MAAALGEAARLVVTAAPVVVGEPGTFAGDVLAHRHPAILAAVHGAHPYGPRQHAALDALADELAGTVTALADHTRHGPDLARWHDWGSHADGRGTVGRSWSELPFLWAEAYFYRRLLAAVDYFAPGPWLGLDPFEPSKAAELAGVAAATLALDGADRQALLLACVAGNRADLGFRAGIAATGGRAAPAAEVLVADDSAALWSALDAGAPARVGLLADNAGLELAADLMLTDHLLATGTASRVDLHVKPHPTFVSDAVGADVSACLRAMSDAGGGPAAVARRLRDAARTGRFALRTHWLQVAPLPFADLATELASELAGEPAREAAGTDLVLVKGDLNYRRLVGDRHWPAGTALAEVTAYLPAPVAVLRTVKSEVVVGLDAGTAAELDRAEPGWRTTGAHALVQFRP